ncbi:hypothetical protein [Paenibacillus periandrae]|uniref:hypothetical protein n=1 Tax=Paenibacillus periandrae TaxID=1761741 RepID=UPI001F09CD8A|nr:hypothetical protein [Paenibacillus periandrae]
MNPKSIIDEDIVHKLFMAGVHVDDIADQIDINVNTLYKFIAKQRRLNPEKWPIRKLGKASKKDVKEGRVVMPILASRPPLPVHRHSASPVTISYMSKEEIERRYGAYKPPTNSDGKVKKAPIGLFSDWRHTREG